MGAEEKDERRRRKREAKSGLGTTGINTPAEGAQTRGEETPVQAVLVDLEKKEVVLEKPRRVWYAPWKRGPKSEGEGTEEHVKVKLTLADINPGPAMLTILSQPHNLLAVVCSGKWDAAGCYERKIAKYLE